VEHALLFIEFASDITALAAAITTLADAALRHRDKHTKND
jgi:hypothetical protein